MRYATMCGLVPPSWEGDHNDLALDAAARYPNRFAVMGRTSLTDTASTDRLARWREQQGMLGVRHRNSLSRAQFPMWVAVV
ncbi:hypothetical protein [Saccharopolyspora spinosa]|nr:hypothetical protein [Saccharopolyspora spinosa]